MKTFTLKEFEFFLKEKDSDINIHNHNIYWVDTYVYGDESSILKVFGSLDTYFVYDEESKLDFCVKWIFKYYDSHRKENYYRLTMEII